MELEANEVMVVAKVRTDKVDLSTYTQLCTLPEGLWNYREQAREITITSKALKTLPEWIGKFDRLEVLRVLGMDWYLNKVCPLRALLE